VPAASAYNLPVPFRIRWQACQSGGAGAGHEGETQNLIVRVRGKWFPSGDTGEAERLRNDPFASDARKSAPGVPVRHTEWLNGVVSPGSLRPIVSEARRSKTLPNDQGRETAVAGINRRTGH